MGLFNGKEVNGLVVKTTENANDIMAVRRDLESNRYEIETLKVEYEKKFKVVLDEILNIRNLSNNKISGLEKENSELKKELEDAIISQKIKGENYTFEDIRKKSGISNMQSADLKFYLHENGVMSMNINRARNSFSLNTDKIESVEEELRNNLIVLDGKLLFKKSFIDYIEKHKSEIEESIERYHTKQKQYIKSSQSLASRNVENYREEINLICGFDSPERWIAIYKVFSKRFKTFYNDFNKYVEEHKGETKYDITKVKYIVGVMGEGNYLLKIACDLFA